LASNPEIGEADDNGSAFDRELNTPPFGGRCKQEFVTSAAWSSQPQSFEPQNPLKMCK
jgi:hypothetical protein